MNDFEPNAQTNDPLRTVFIAAALVGLMTKATSATTPSTMATIARLACQQADAVLDEMAKGRTQCI